MPVVNFSIPKTLDKRIAEAIKCRGFASKAEFFRFAAIKTVEEEKKDFCSEDERFEYLTSAVEKEIIKKFSGKKISSVREQLANIK